MRVLDSKAPELCRHVRALQVENEMPSSILHIFAWTSFVQCGVGDFKPEVVKYLWDKLIFDGPKAFGCSVACSLALSQDSLIGSTIETLKGNLKTAVTIDSLQEAAAQAEGEFANWQSIRDELAREAAREKRRQEFRTKVDKFVSKTKSFFCLF